MLVRVTPGIEADTHRKIATGHAASKKFGLPPAAAVEALRIAAGLEHVRPAGLHVHLGSQIHDIGTYLEAAEWLAGFIAEHDLGRLPVLDLGGGPRSPTRTRKQTSRPTSARRSTRRLRGSPSCWPRAGCRCPS